MDRVRKGPAQNKLVFTQVAYGLNTWDSMLRNRSTFSTWSELLRCWCSIQMDGINNKGIWDTSVQLMEQYSNMGWQVSREMAAIASSERDRYENVLMKVSKPQTKSHLSRTLTFKMITLYHVEMLNNSLSFSPWFIRGSCEEPVNLSDLMNCAPSLFPSPFNLLITHFSRFTFSFAWVTL